MITYTKIYHKKFPLWRKKYRPVGLEAKTIYLYLLSNPLTHHSGIFEFNEVSLINAGLNQKQIDKGVSELLANGLITVDKELEYILIPYLVENIKIDNKNMAKSLINYILELEETFLIYDFQEILIKSSIYENLANRLGTAEEQLLNSYLTVTKQLANKDKVLSIKDNKLNTSNNVLNIKKEELSINKENNKELKEQKALLEKDALDVYQFYFQNIKGGERKNTLKLLIDILKQETKESLIVAIQNYIIKQKEIGNNDFKYYKAPQFFFSKANEFYKDYLGYDLNKRKMFIKEVYNINKQLGKNHVEKELKRIKEIYISFITDKEISEARDIILDSSEVAF